MPSCPLLAGDSQAAIAAADEAQRVGADPSAGVTLVTRLVRGITLMTWVGTATAC